MNEDINKSIATLEKAVQYYINNNDDALECSSLYGSFVMVKLALEQFTLLDTLSKTTNE
jgi:hypothetical protein